MSIKPELHNHDFIRSAYHADCKHTKCMQLTTVQKKCVLFSNSGCELPKSVVRRICSLSDIKLTQTRAHFKSGVSYIIETNGSGIQFFWQPGRSK